MKQILRILFTGVAELANLQRQARRSRQPLNPTELSLVSSSAERAPAWNTVALPAERSQTMPVSRRQQGSP
jgi:hypothetical protein